ncbi:MAG: prolipoprotein diacylglyceryl transferase [Rhodothermales bacterium]
MYPRISDIFPDLFGFNFPIPIHSFGAMVAVGFLLAAWVSGKELDRRHRAGLIGSVRVPVRRKKGQKEKKGKRVAMQEASPSVLIQPMAIIAVISGVAGAKLFHILENFGRFMQDPLGMIFSTGGLTFFGGLIVAALAVIWYLRKKGLHVPTFADALAPGLILGYGVGRIGCHLAGDGDWGIAADVASKPGWIPSWLWVETYPNRIYNPIDFPETGVFPTPLYEFLMCAVLFGILWGLRKHPFKTGWLFSLYVVFTGIERFLIEQIRVNNEFDLFGLTATQAEIISVTLILIGVVGLVLTTKKVMPDHSKEQRAGVVTQRA